MTAPTLVDTAELESKVQAMYHAVATDPGGQYHFEMGRALAEQLGYPSGVLDRIPDGAIESFAGVGYHFDLADLKPDERVLDLGSGSGMDAFFAALRVGQTGHVDGIDMTPAQLAKAEMLRTGAGFGGVEFTLGHIEDLPFADATFDVVISNGVINLSPAKGRVFAEVARVLRPGGRMAIADIVTERPLTEAIVCNTDLWASCIGGAAHHDTLLEMLADAGLGVVATKDNPYQFISRQARGASAEYGVKSVSLLAENAGVTRMSVGQR